MADLLRVFSPVRHFNAARHGVVPRQWVNGTLFGFSGLVPLQHLRQLRTLRTARIIHIVRNSLNSFANASANFGSAKHHRMISRPFSSRRPSRTWRLVFCRSRPQARSFRQCAETLFRLLWGWRGLCSGSCVGFGSCITKVVAPSRQTPPRLSPQPQASGVPWRFPKIRGEGFDRSAFRRAWTIWRVGCPDQNVPSIARVAAGAFGFLTLIQVFDGSSHLRHRTCFGLRCRCTEPNRRGRTLTAALDRKPLPK